VKISDRSSFQLRPLGERIPADHPLRAVRTLIDEALNGLSRDFNKLYARDGKPSIPAERAVAGAAAAAFYTVRSERQLMEQLNYNLLFRWFVGLSADDQVWNATSSARTGIGCPRRRYRGQVLCQRVEPAPVRKLLSGEHFSVDAP